jgi:hypothetical protein
MQHFEQEPQSLSFEAPQRLLAGSVEEFLGVENDLSFKGQATDAPTSKA